MKFNSQICTSREQSERLLALGLNTATADMHHYRWSEGYWAVQACPPRGDAPTFIPAWSLHRLIEMLNRQMQTDGKYVFLAETGFDTHANIYDNIIDCIEWLIKEGYFNMEYLV